MVTSKYLPSRVHALAQSATMFWVSGKKEQKSMVYFRDIHDFLLPTIRAAPEVQRWQQNLLPNDLSLTTYVIAYIIALCGEYDLSHDIAPVVVIKSV